MFRCFMNRKANLEIDYELDDKLPIQIVNNVLDNGVLKLLQKYFWYKNLSQW